MGVEVVGVVAVGESCAGGALEVVVCLDGSGDSCVGGALDAGVWFAGRGACAVELRLGLMATIATRPTPIIPIGKTISRARSAC